METESYIVAASENDLARTSTPVSFSHCLWAGGGGGVVPPSPTLSLRRFLLHLSLPICVPSSLILLLSSNPHFLLLKS